MGRGGVAGCQLDSTGLLSHDPQAWRLEEDPSQDMVCRLTYSLLALQFPRCPSVHG